MDHQQKDTVLLTWKWLALSAMLASSIMWCAIGSSVGSNTAA